MSFFDRRTTGDLLVLMVAGTVCLTVLITVCALVVIRILDPDADTSSATAVVGDVINTLIGLLAGFMAGRTDVHLKEESEVEPPQPTSIADETLPRRPL